MIPLFKVAMTGEAIKAVEPVLRSGYIGQGKVVDAFEDALQATLMVDEKPITTNSCTSAIQLALMLCGVGPGDEVITTPITCTATNSPIVLLGARPVWADVSPITGNINPDDVAAKITPRTKAIIAVDWSGRACEYDELRRASGYIPIIQDAAHGPLTPYGGDYVCLSFGPIKHLTAGDGGALILTGIRFETTEQAKRARLLRWYGLDRTKGESFRCGQDIVEVGTKLHMNDINAAIGLANLGFLEGLIALHRSNAAFFERDIQNKHVEKPISDPSSCWWVYTLTVDDRESFVKHMTAHEIATSQVHARNDKHSGFNYPNGWLLGVAKFDSDQVSIPCGWWLSSSDIDKIVEAVNSWTP